MRNRFFQSADSSSRLPSRDHVLASHSPGSLRLLRTLAFTVCSIAIIVLVVACQPHMDPFATPFSDVTGALPDRGLTVDDRVAKVGNLPNGFSYPDAPGPGKRTDKEVVAMNASCINCHTQPDHKTMHKRDASLTLSCIDCHGGNQVTGMPAKLAAADPGYDDWKLKAHVQPRLPDLWKDPGNPPIPGTLTNLESNDYIRFVNPGDLRAAAAACAACHNDNKTNIQCQFVVNHVRTNMMAGGQMLWEAALYNNGSVPRKNAIYGEFYDVNGTVSSATARPFPTTQEAHDKGYLAKLWPLTRWEVTQPGNILRVFERGDERRPIVGIPDPLELPGRPDVKLSERGLGTELRTDPVFIGLQKSRLLDPTLNLFGTNDHAGDFRGSGCTACHVVYANDHSVVHSAMWGPKFGNTGQSFSSDPTVAKSAMGKRAIYPVKHQFDKSVPTSSCIVCHVHPGTNVVNAYLGFTWWDNETDGQMMYPKQQRYPTPDDEYRVSQSNPEGSAVRGLWSDPKFLEQVGSDEFNAKLKHTQFADFHGHGWVFRAVFKQDKHGNMLDHDGNIISDVDASKMKQGIDFQSTLKDPTPHANVPVHLKDIHLEKGMHCVDCHFRQDVHGDGNLYGETRAAVEVDCVDCHGTPQKPAVIAQFLAAGEDLKVQNAKRAKTAAVKKAIADDNTIINGALLNVFSGNAAAAKPDKAELAYRSAMITSHFKYDTVKKALVQIPSVDATMLPDSMVVKDPKGQKVTPIGWNVVQVTDTENPASWWATGPEGSSKIPQDGVSHSRLAMYAHTIRRDGTTYGGAVPPDPVGSDAEMAAANNPLSLAHANSKMSCYACHSSWNTSCFGCHLPQRANQRKPMLHNEGAITRNYTNYNYQTLRDDVYMLGVDSTVKGHKIVPVRSACAVMVSSQNVDREWIYHQQQTVSAEGYSGTAFSPYFPHTVRGVETKQCTDCHVSKAGDNNAVMAQVLMQGTHAVNFVGRYAWVAEGNGGLQAVAVTEHDEPQAVIGSRLHEVAYPDFFKQHVDRGLKLNEAYGHDGTVLDVQVRGEYLYAACGSNGFIAYDVAHIDDKNFSERIITAPVSPLGQRFYVPSRYATSICSPSTMAIDPTRPHYAVNEENPNISLLYAFLYMTDKYEGLIVIGNPLTDPKPGVSTLLDGNPENNFLQRALTFNPDGILNGAKSVSLYGNYAYVCCDAGIVVLDLKDPLHPRVIETPGLTQLHNPRKIVFQFRYGFVIDDEGVKAINMTDPENPMIQSLFGTGMKADYPLTGAKDICLCRTYAYVADGSGGLVILNVEKPEDSYSWNPMVYGNDGTLVDATSVRVAMTNSSLFAYIADGIGGMKVLQLTSPDDTPTYLGFSPQPSPRLIATCATNGPALAISAGLDRDRAVDESGNQLSVFGRRGARPFNLEEQQRLYLQTDPITGQRKVYTVTNGPWNEPIK